jgi:hypothetical protein
MLLKKLTLASRGGGGRGGDQSGGPRPCQEAWLPLLMIIFMDHRALIKIRLCIKYFYFIALLSQACGESWAAPGGISFWRFGLQFFFTRGAKQFCRGKETVLLIFSTT